MKAVKPLGLSGVGLGLLYFVLEAADIEIPRWALWILGIASISLIVYGIVGWLIRPAKEHVGTVGQVSSIGSSGPTVGVIEAGRDISITAVMPAAKAAATVLTLEIEELEPLRIPNWDNDWRVTIRVRNTSETADISAYLVAPVGGLAESNYGDINLQWDSVNTNFSTLITGKPERLHIARISNRRMVRFLSPGQYGGLPREFQHKSIKVTDSPIRGKLVFNGRGGGCEQRHVEIHLDHENRPSVHVGEAEPHD